MPRSAKKNGRDPEPSALIIDSQSVKADAWAEDTGYDAGKKIKGIKRHVIVDVLGLLIGIVVHSAAIQDRDGAKLLLLRVKAARLGSNLSGRMAAMPGSPSSGSGMGHPGLLT
ncbi:MAG: transposase [Planctomycetota bacterium]|nr:transposase [Planctomycetota bacterium]